MKTKLFSLLLILLSFTQINAQCWQAISAGYYTTSAIKNDGTLWVWGDRSVTVSPAIHQTSPLQIGTSNDWKFTVSKNFMIASIKNDGTLWMMHSFDTLPIQVGTDTNWKSIDIGSDWYVAIKTNGTLWTWGTNRYGEIGLGSNYVSNPTVPVQIGTDNNWQSVTAGQDHRVAIKFDGTLWGWGANGLDGKLGIGNSTIRLYVPTQIGSSTDWKFISAGNNHTVAIKTDNTLWSWGDNFNGQLGLNNNVDKYAPTQIQSIPDVWKAVSAEGNHTLAVSSFGRLFSWGYNNYGQIGNGTKDAYVSINFPLQIGTSTLWQSVSAGEQYSIALQTNGAAFVWGQNSDGQLGDGTIIDKLVPNQILCPNSLGLEKTIVVDNSFSIYPNPVNDILHIQSSTNQVIDKIVITELTGKKILEQKGNNKQLNVQQLQQGIYLLQVFSEGKSSQSKFIKQ
jgi:alpha-tubulin suppressor-like RCC1 family protein